jgi:chromate transporter
LPPPPGAAPRRVQPLYTLWQLAGYMLRLGSIGFGGPVALVGYMRRDLVEQKHWISESDYKEGLTLAQLMPGPLAAQLAMYLGFVDHGVLGASVAGVAFVIPSFIMVLGLGWAYSLYGGLIWMQAVLYGVGATVISIIAISAYKLTIKTIGQDWLLWVIYLASAAATVITEAEFVVLFLGAGVIYWLVKAPPAYLWRTPRASSILPLAFTLPGVPSADSESLLKMGLFFAKAGAFVFGSGLAIIPFLYSGVVKEYGWLNERQFLDAVAVAMITPGPVVITTGFIGFLVGGVSGAVIAGVATFLPCYVFTIIPAPYFRKHGKRPGLAAFINGVTAAAVGAISGAVIVLGRKTLFNAQGMPDVFKIGLFAVSFVLLWKFKKLPEPLIVLAAAVLGLLCYPLIAHWKSWKEGVS